MIVAAMVMEKGGVGKTTTALELAFGLARNERRVLMLDLDPQAKLANGLGLRRRIDASRPNLYHVLVDEVPIAEAVVAAPSKSACGRIDVVPGHRAMERVKDALEGKHEPEPQRALERALHVLAEEHPERYEFVIVDCPPSLGFLTVTALLAADYTVIPTQTHQQAVDGYPETIDLIERARRRNPKLKVVGTLPTQYRRTNADKEAIALLEQDFAARVLDPISLSVRFTEAYSGGISIADYDRDASEGYEKLTDRFLALLSEPVPA